jgi:hypothetical protein
MQFLEGNPYKSHLEDEDRDEKVPSQCIKEKLDVKI